MGGKGCDRERERRGGGGRKKVGGRVVVRE